MPFKPNDPKKKKAARGYRDYGDNLHKSEGVIAAFFIFVEWSQRDFLSFLFLELPQRLYSIKDSSIWIRGELELNSSTNLSSAKNKQLFPIQQKTAYRSRPCSTCNSNEAQMLAVIGYTYVLVCTFLFMWPYIFLRHSCYSVQQAEITAHPSVMVWLSYAQKLPKYYVERQVSLRNARNAGSHNGGATLNQHCWAAIATVPSAPWLPFTRSTHKVEQNCGL